MTKKREGEVANINDSIACKRCQNQLLAILHSSIYVCMQANMREQIEKIKSICPRSFFLLDVQSFLHIDEMIICRLMTTLFLTVLHTMTNSLNADSHIPRDHINVNVGKRIRMECELSNSTMSGNMKVSSIINDIHFFLHLSSNV